MKIAILSLLILAIFGSGVYYYFDQGPGGASGYIADFSKIIGDSGVIVSNIACEQVGYLRKVVCHFQSNKNDLDVLNNYLQMSSPRDPSGLMGDFLFMSDDKNPCDYLNRVERGDLWKRASWQPSKTGTKLNTYSGGSIIYDESGVDVCIILDVAYG